MAHAVLGAVVAQAQGNSAAAGAAGAAGGELVARLITQQLYGTSDSNSLSEEQKQTVSALSTLAAGLSGGLAEGNSAGAVAGAGAGRNAVENNLLANKYGVERLDAASRALYEKLKAAGIGSIDELHERYKACGGNGGCEVGIRDEYRQQEKQAGEKLVELYQSGRLSKAEYDLLVTDYALAMMRGGVDAQKSDADASFLDVYALSGSDWSPMGVVANPYVNAIRASELIAEWRRQGLTEEAINERARQDGLLGSTLAAVDVPGIISLVDKGATRDDVVKLAAVVILGKATSGAKGTATDPKVTIKDHYDHHLNMVDDIKDQLSSQGFRVSEKEISFGSFCGTGRCRPDIVAEAPDGTLRIIEVKTGGADLSIRQSEIFPQIKDGASIPRGKVAESFGLTPGVPLKDQGYPNGIPIEIMNFPGAKL